MNKITLIVIFIFISMVVFSQENISTTIEIQNIKKKGPILVAVYNNAVTFLSDEISFKADTLNAGNESFYRASFFDLPPGKYAIAVFVDENNNGILDTNFIGIPSEQYGFTGNKLPKMRAPKFEESAIDISKTNTKFFITLN